MEHELRIETNDAKVIHSRFREVAGAPIVVISHGMTGHMNGRLEVNFARLLEREGYSSLRYNSYDWHDDARNLNEIGLREHLDDLATVIDWAAKRSGSVIALGHSFGGMCVVLRGSAGLAGGVVWDPASQKVWSEKNRNSATFDADRREYVQRSGVAIIYSERMLEEVERADATAAAASFQAPLLVVSAQEWAHFIEAGKEFADLAPISERVEIVGADHNFTSDEFETKLFDVTIDWLRRTVPV